MTAPWTYGGMNATRMASRHQDGSLDIRRRTDAADALAAVPPARPCYSWYRVALACALD